MAELTAMIESGKAGIVMAAEIVVGAFIGAFVIGLVAQYVPVVGTYAPELMLIAGAAACVYAPAGIAKHLAMGATVAGAFATFNKYMPSLSATISAPLLTAKTA